MRSIRPSFNSIRFVSLLFLLFVVAFVARAQKDHKSAPAPAPKAAAPAAKPAQPAHPPANANRPAAGGAANANRPGAAGTPPGATGAAANRPGTTGGAVGANKGAGLAAKPGTAGAAGNTHAGAGGAAAKAGAPVKQPGTVTHPGGGKTVTTKSGNTREYNKTGKISGVSTKSGHEAKFDSHGKIASIHTNNGATITHGPRGERRVVGERVNARGEHYRVVNAGRGGYVAHTYVRGGYPYERRTYVYGGTTYAYAYRGYYYNNVVYYNYVPAYYYGPAYYGWAYNPWPAPVYYTWGWGAAPWYGYYGPYFAPAPAYPYASLWLADFLLAENLRLAYEAAAAAGGSAMLSPDYAPYMVVSRAAAREGVTSFGGGMEFNAEAAAAALSPEVKQMIADEVKSQIDAEKDSAANPQGNTAKEAVPAALDPKHRIFVVSTTLNASVGEDSCSLTAGDVIRREEDQADKDNSVQVKVLSGESNDCEVGSMPRVQVNELQDMHNDFRQKMDAGLNELSKGGKGLPAAPDTKKTASPDGQVQPDLTAQNDLQAQQADADSAEKEVQAATSEPEN